VDDSIATAQGSHTTACGLRVDRLARWPTTSRSRVFLNDKPVPRYNQGRSNKSFEHDRRGRVSQLACAAVGALIRAAASTKPFDCFAFAEAAVGVASYEQQPFLL